MPSAEADHDAHLFWLTLLGAVGFLVNKYFEYEHKFHVN